MILARLQFPYTRSAYHLSRMGETGTAFWCLVRDEGPYPARAAGSRDSMNGK